MTRPLRFDDAQLLQFFQVSLEMLWSEKRTFPDETKREITDGLGYSAWTAIPLPIRNTLRMLDTDYGVILDTSELVVGDETDL